jgi:hypothetical protein
MRNLKLKKVRPVATETETLHKNGDDLGLHLVGGSSVEESSSRASLHKVKETPGLHVMGDLYDVKCSEEFMVDADWSKMPDCPLWVNFFTSLMVRVA